MKLLFMVLWVFFRVCIVMCFLIMGKGGINLLCWDFGVISVEIGILIESCWFGGIGLGK